MALLPPTFLDAVLAIGVGHDPATRNWIGTGFLYGVEDKKSDPIDKRYYVFLVSNKHVLDGHLDIWLKFNAISGTGSRDFRTPMIAKNGRELWIRHPDSNIDLGARLINAQVLHARNMRFSYFVSDEHTYTVAQLRSEGISEGDGVYVLGYPMGLVDSKWRSAICRLGCIARIQDVLTIGTGDFLIDASVFPGNSGGPVVLQPHPMAKTGVKKPPKANLIGVVQSYLPYQDVAISIQTHRPRVTFTENSGLSPVIPMDRVNELMAAAMKRVQNRPSPVRWTTDQQPGLTPARVDV